ncbi:hypothetical protein BSKO_04815 [Bryopsis sp. KO-2023]|nr:hypothetical protein BSKO_04815 [Bryopsis sp. KO-2023]
MPRDAEGQHIGSERSCCESFLRRLFSAINYFLLVVGLVLVGYSVYLVKMVRSKEASAQQSDEDANSESSALVTEEHYWFVEVVAISGVWTVLLALCALVGTNYGKACCLGSHTVMVVVALLVEGTLLILFCVNKTWDADHLVPWDESGAYDDVRSFVAHHLRVSLYIGATLVFLQILTLLLGCAVWNFASGATRDGDEEEENEIWRRPLLSEARSENGSGMPNPSSKPRDDPWSQRMRVKYGLDTSKFSYDPEATQSRRKLDRERSPAGYRDSDEKKRKCSIM